ncbi:unnamed protein product [Dicrocoelium dendriticum]|nr:unnamed protein product [Dicrocoelium dendriticum]
MNELIIVHSTVPSNPNTTVRQNVTCPDGTPVEDSFTCCSAQENRPDFSREPSLNDAFRQSERSASWYQWSMEERMFRRKRTTDKLKHDGGFMYSNMYKDSVPSCRFLFDELKYDFGIPSPQLHPSPVMGHEFSGRHSKIFSDPTFVLSLVRWARVGTSRLIGDDDQIDRLNYQITTLILLLLIALTGMRQYLSYLPLQCWIPQEFSRSWEEYAEHFCWVTNTYFANVKARIPENERKHVVRYYQWAPFVLVLQAAGFILPCVIWRLLQNYSGYHVHRIMRTASQVVCASPASSTATIQGLANYMDAVTCRRKYKFWKTKFTNYQCHQYPPKPNPPVSTSAPHTVQFRSPMRQSTMWNIEYGTSKPSAQFEARSTKRGTKPPAPQPPTVNSSDNKPKSEGIQRSRTHSRSSQSNRQSCFACCIHKSAKRVKATATEKEACHSSLLPPGGKPITKTNGNCLCLCSTRMHAEPFSKNQSKKYEGHVTRHPTPPASKNARRQPHPKGCQAMIMLKRLGRILWFVFRLLSTLVCLIPGCLCHWFRGSQRSNSFLFYLYTTVKLFYLINLVGQICFMKIFLDAESHLFGFLMLRDLIQGKAWTETGNFPRVTFCEFEAKKMGKNYRYTLQCVLPLNLFLEKVYVFLWLWLTFVAVLTVYSLFKWLFRLSIPESRYEFICKFLFPWKSSDTFEQQPFDQLDKHYLRMFVDEYLDRNGVFLLWLVSVNVGSPIAGELTSALWDLFLSRVTAIPPVSQVNASGSPAEENVNVAFEYSSSSEPGRQNMKVSSDTRQGARFSPTCIPPIYSVKKYSTLIANDPATLPVNTQQQEKQYKTQLQTDLHRTLIYEQRAARGGSDLLYKHEAASSLDSIV